jgi:protein-tyrosine phosphatase
MQAQADGVCAICATPHIRFDHAVVIEELPERRAQLTASLLTAGCRTRVLAGGEVAATMVDALEDSELAAVSLGGSGRWILLEPAPGPLEDRFEHAVEALQARGFRALIAHPERHAGPDLIERLGQLTRKNGALVQATAAFFTDPEIRPSMLELAQAGVVHVLGSDSHSSRAGRPVRLAAAFEALRVVQTLAPHLEWMAHTAPLAIVRGQDPVPPFPARPPEP